MTWIAICIGVLLVIVAVPAVAKVLLRYLAAKLVSTDALSGELDQFLKSPNRFMTIKWNAGRSKLALRKCRRGFIAVTCRPVGAAAITGDEAVGGFRQLEKICGGETARIPVDDIIARICNAIDVSESDLLTIREW